MDLLKNDKSIINLQIKNDKHILIVPEGYKYCMDCEALTPHQENSYHIFHCKICDNSIYYCDNCPNCGWEPPELDGPDYYNITVHQPGCHFNENSNELDDNPDTTIFNSYYNSIASRIFFEFKENNPHLNLEEDIECGCPKYVIYTNLHIFNYISRSIYSMDCSNAIEWSYDIRCPICGEIYQVCDSNC